MRPSPFNHAFGKTDLDPDAALKKQLLVLGVVVFVACLGLVTLNAYCRDVADRMDTDESIVNYGPGASYAAESRFPPMSPTASRYASFGTTEPMRSMPAIVNQYQCPGYGAPTQMGQQPSFMQMPVNDGNGVRIRQIVTR